LDINVPVKHTSCVVPNSPQQVLDLSTSKWVTRDMGLPSRQISASTVRDLGSGTGQTDRQMERKQPSNVVAFQCAQGRRW